jgi:hypothetical protein
MHANRNTCPLCLIHLAVTSPDSNMIQFGAITVTARAIPARSVVKQITNGFLSKRDPLANCILGSGGSRQSHLLPSSLSSLTHRILRQTRAYPCGQPALNKGSGKPAIQSKPVISLPCSMPFDFPEHPPPPQEYGTPSCVMAAARTLAPMPVPVSPPPAGFRAQHLMSAGPGQ